ncbi:MAG: hypothetical protein E7378_04605, partial [Clostridiales bacterium]|nr:hypothetical protein [Clostridiales bacterium]
GNEYYYSKNNCIISKLEPTKLVAGCNTSVIPNFITTICNHAFYRCAGLTSITIPDSVTSIGEWAFVDYTSLTGVKFENINGWRVKTVSYPTATTGTAVEIKDDTSAENLQFNANLLTNTYKNYYWARFDQ